MIHPQLSKLPCDAPPGNLARKNKSQLQVSGGISTLQSRASGLQRAPRRAFHPGRKNFSDSQRLLLRKSIRENNKRLKITRSTKLLWLQLQWLRLVCGLSVCGLTVPGPRDPYTPMPPLVIHIITILTNCYY